MTSRESRLAETLIGRIERFRQGKTDLPSLILELQLFVETYDSEQADWTPSFARAWSNLVQCAEPFLRDPAHSTPPDSKTVDRHLSELERLLRIL